MWKWQATWSNEYMGLIDNCVKLEFSDFNAMKEYSAGHKETLEEEGEVFDYTSEYIKK